jgi:tetratricopeptide (TPR) repeat protein
MGTGGGVCLWWLASWFALTPDSAPTEKEAPAQQASPQAAPTQKDEAQIEKLRRDANETLLRGEYDRARRDLEEILRLHPQDAPAQRDAARAAQAAGNFDYAAAALERAHHFEKHTADPELHYLRGEALYVLGRDDEARREHHIAELEIGPTPTDKMQKLWLARVYARRGYLVLADRLYESMEPPPPKFDSEVWLNHADAHLLNEDWTGAMKVLEKYLALDPKNLRAREMMAWAAEASGNLTVELAVRQSLVSDHPTAEHRRDYGRALERATNYRAARGEYQEAIAASGTGADVALVTSYRRMRFRTSPELTGGAQLRSDPQAWAWRLQTGGALPFGSRHQAAVLAWHDSSSDWNANQVVGDQVLSERGSVTGLGGLVVLGHRSGASALLGGDARMMNTTGDNAAGDRVLTSDYHFTAGAQGELDAPILSFAQVNVHGDLNEQWNEAPITVHEGGTTTGGIGHLYLFPKNRVVMFDGGAQLRRLSLAARDGVPDATASQVMYWGGIDFNLWASPTRIVRGESLDERLVRRTYLADAGVLAYRHYELHSDISPEFSQRIALAPRSSIDNGTLIIRKALFSGRGGFDIHGGGGYDHIRERVLAQAGAAIVFAASWSTRFVASYDMAHETATGLPGTLQIAWLSVHADL